MVDHIPMIYIDTALDKPCGKPQNTRKGALTSCKQLSSANIRENRMAIYHCSIKPISRSAGRSATAAAAYRSGTRIIDERTGEIHDYTRRSGVEDTELVLPENVTASLGRAEVWNAAESAERRKDARVAREVEIALPNELTADQRKALAVNFARQIAERYGIAADVCIHQPGKEGDHRNHHAHILLTTRQITPDGSLGVKSDLELEDKALKAAGKPTGRQQVEALRETWATICNQALERAGHSERIDHRTLKAQGIEQEATVHLGPAATAMERHGTTSRKGDFNRQVFELREAEEAKRKRKLDPAARPRPDVLSPQAELARALRDAGLVIEGDPVMNGQIQRVPVVGGKPGATQGHYCATMADDHPNGWWQNHRTAKQSRWIYTAHVLTDEARERLREENAEKLKGREEERRRANQAKQPQPPQEQEAERSHQASRDDDEWER